MSDSTGGTPRRSLFTLIGDVPRLLGDLVRAEIASLKKEITTKLAEAGIGLGLLAGAAVFAFFLVGVLITAAILGLAVALPGWAAALIVAAVLLAFAVVLALLGIRELKSGTPPTPTNTIASIRKDAGAITGTGKRD